MILFNRRLGALLFSDIKKASPKISDRMLIKSLTELKEDNLTSSEVLKDVPERVDYAITLRAKSLLSVFNVMSKRAARKYLVA